MKDLISQLVRHQPLSRTQAREAMLVIGSGNANPSQIATFCAVFMMRNITVDELTGLRDAMLELCVPVDLSAYNTIDIVGTGGDGKNTFNISTLSSFVVAGAGFKVAKHGNYGVSSAVGSSNVLEYLGYKFTGDADVLRKQVENAGICMMHAPLFHPAMKNVAPVRKELGMKTIFNMLGPMTNPSLPKNQMLGTYSMELARLYGYIYQNLDKNFVIVHSLDGYDEISLTGPFKMVSAHAERVVQPEELGFARVDQKDLWGGDTAEDAAKIFMGVLNNEGTAAQKNAVLANSGFAIWCMNQKQSWEESIAVARESLESGKALTAFKKLIANN